MQKVRHVKIKDLPECIRPRERMLAFGASNLTTPELLALLLSTGNSAETAVQLGERLLAQYGGLRSLLAAEIEEMSQVKGVGVAKACRVKAALELTKRLANETPNDRDTVRNPQGVANIFMEQMRYLTKEELKVAYVNVKQQIIGVETVSVGSLDCSIVHPREVFRQAIKKSCAGIIVVHNHPSGDPTPSKDDIQITQRLGQAGKLIGIELIDHVVIGDGTYISMREQGLITI